MKRTWNNNWELNALKLGNAALEQMPLYIEQRKSEADFLNMLNSFGQWIWENNIKKRQQKSITSIFLMLIINFMPGFWLFLHFHLKKCQEIRGKRFSSHRDIPPLQRCNRYNQSCLYLRTTRKAKRTTGSMKLQMHWPCKGTWRWTRMP